MSKMDNLRALRESRYARDASPGVNAADGPKRATATAAPKPVEAPVAVETADEGLCGHRAISGRTCTREHGHAAKSHRYS